MPNSISGNILWLQSDAGITLNDTLVSVWADQSGSNNNAFQSISGQQPKLVPNALTGKPVVRFDGVNDFVEFPELKNIRTVFFVVKHSPGGTDYQTILGHATTYHFLGSYDTRIFLPGVSSANITNGSGYLNGNEIVVSSVERQDKFSIFSFITIGDVEAQYVGSDRQVPGRYWKGDYAEIIIYDRALNDTERKSIEQYLDYKYSGSPVNLGIDISINGSFCDTTLSAGSSFSAYSWNTGATTSSIKVNKAGTYWVTVTDIFGYTSSDSVVVSYPLISGFSSKNKVVCFGDSMVLNTLLDKTKYSFLWSDNSIDSKIIIKQADKYYVKVTDQKGCFAQSDTLITSIDSFSVKATLGPDALLCEGNKIGLVQGANSAVSYLWKGGSTDSTLKIIVADSYFVNVINTIGCIKKDTINITLKGLAPLVDFSTSGNCFKDITLFKDLSSSSDGIINSWVWDFADNTSSSDQNPSHNFSTAGTYNVKLTVFTSKGCFGETIQPLKILVLPKPNFDFNFNPGITVQFQDKSLSTDSPINYWLWNFGESGSLSSGLPNPVFQYKKDGFYQVKLVVNTEAGCIDSLSKEVNTFNFVPLSISGNILWLKSDAGITLNDTLVSGWADQSGNNNNAFQSIVGQQPELVPNALTGKPVVRFDGVNDFVEFPELKNIRTVFFVVKHSPGGTDYQPILGHATTYHFLGSPDTRIFLPGVSSANITNGSGYLNGDEIVVSSVERQDKFSIFSFITIGDVEAQYVGSDRQSPGRYWKGDYAEIIIYDRVLNDTERKSIEQYLDYKYSGSPVNLGIDITVNGNFCDTTLNAGPSFSVYSWNTGATTSSIKVNKAGTYWVTVTDIFGYTSSDSVVVSYPLISGFSSQNKTVCLGDSIVLNTLLDKTKYSFLWSDNSIDSKITIKQADKYYVKVTDQKGCFAQSDTLITSIDSFPVKATLGPDVALCEGNKIGLVQGASSAVSYLWNDNTTDSTKAINVGDKYSVVVNNFNNCIKKDTINITIKGTAPVVNFSSSSTCIDDSTVFKDLSVPLGSTITSWEWSFGDTIKSFLKNPSHKFKISKDYKVSLTVLTLNGCSNSLQKTIVVNPKPFPLFVIPNACSGNLVTFTNSSTIAQGSIKKWLWNFGDSDSGVSDTSTRQSPTHNFLNGGTYIINLSATSDSGCVNVISQVVTIKETPNVGFTYVPACEGSYVSFFDTTSPNFPSTISTWSWNFNDGSPVSFTPSHLYLGTGVFSATLTVTASNNCSASITKPVNVNPKPKVSFTTTPNIICSGIPAKFTDSSTLNGTIASWKWNFGSIGTSTVRDPSLVFPDTGFYSIKLVVSSTYGCKDSVVKKIHASTLPVAIFSFDPTFGSAPLTVNFNNKTIGATSYSWDFGDGSSLESSKNPTHIFADNDTFKVCLKAINSNGCIRDLCKEIRVIPTQLDIAVKDVSITQMMNHLSIFATISNLGTRDIYYFEAVADIGNGAMIQEIFNDTLFAGETLGYKFKGAFQINPNKSPAFYCVIVENPNKEIDADVSNNKKCGTLNEKLQVMDLFPNPSLNHSMIQYILPDPDIVTITLFDERGAKVRDLFSGEALKGLNELSIDTKDLHKGIYACKLQYRENVVVKKMIKL